MPGLFSGTPLERPVTCERCEKPLAECRCPREAGGGGVVLPRDQAVRVQRERRRDKVVTVVRGLRAGPDDAPDLPAFLKTLKARFGSGGTLARDGGTDTLELQGDHRDKVVEYLRSLGYPAKASGG